MQILFFLAVFLLPHQALYLLLRKDCFWEREFQVGYLASFLLHRPDSFIKLVDIHFPSDLTCTLAEIPFKKRSMRRVDPRVCPMSWKGPSPGHPELMRIFLASISETVIGSFPSVLKLLTHLSPKATLPTPNFDAY